MAREQCSTLENWILSLFLSHSSHAMIAESLEPIFSEAVNSFTLVLFLVQDL